MASLGIRTTTLVIHSSRPSQNMWTVSDLLQAWEGGGWLPSPPLESLWCECNNVTDCQGSVIKHAFLPPGDRQYGGQSAWLVESERCSGRCIHLWWYFLQQVMGSILWLTFMEQQSGGSIPLCTSACFCSILSFTDFVDRSSIHIWSKDLCQSH